MRKIRNLLQLLMLVFVCFSCQESELDSNVKNSISIKDNLSEVSFSKSGGTQTISLTANNKWSANITNIEDETWVTIDIKEGKAGEDQVMTITAIENPDTIERESEVIIICGNIPVKVAIRQAQQDDIIVPEGEKDLVFSKDKPRMIVEIDANVDMEIEVVTGTETEEQWLFCVPTPTFIETKNIEKKSYTITTIPNYGIERTGSVIFKNIETGVGDTITVTQPNIGLGDIVITNPSAPPVDITGESQEYKITVKSENIEGLNIAISDITSGADIEWITDDSIDNPPVKDGDETYIYTFKVKENKLAQRDAKITFTDINNSELVETINLSQKIKLDKLDISLTSDTDWTSGTDITADKYKTTIYKFSITTETTYTVTGETATITSGSGESGTQDIKISIPANNTGGNRDINITFATAVGATQSSEIVTFKQGDPNDVVVDYAEGTLESSITALIGTSGVTKTSITKLTITGISVLTVTDFTYMKGATALTDLDISKSKILTATSAGKFIPEDALKEHVALERVKLYESVETLEATTKAIAARAFQGCEKLKEITFPKGMTNFQADAFQGCILLNNLHFPATIKGFGQRAFKGCSVLTNVRIDAINAPSVTPTNNETFDTRVNFKVPSGRVMHYKDSANWGRHAGKITEQ